MIRPEVFKICSRCDHSKPLSEYYLRNGKPGARCKDCVREESREYSRIHRAERNEKNRQWRLANAERHRENARKWYRNNTERALARTAKWSEQNREKTRLANRKSYAKHRKQRLESIENYRVENSDWFREYNRLKASARRAKERGNLAIKFTSDQLSERVAYYGGKCWICRVAEYEHIDHVKPVSKGGAHILANLRPACASCNLSKNGKWPFAVTARLEVA